MASIGALRTALQTRLATISGLYAYEVTTGAERMPCSIVFPLAPSAGRFSMATCGETHEFLVEVHCNLAQGMERAQDQLDALISPTGTGSVQVAIRADSTLGGLAGTVDVRAFRQYRLSQLNKIPTIMAQIPVTVETV